MTPAARLVYAGQDISTKLMQNGGPLISLVVTDEAGIKSDTVEIEFDDRERLPSPTKGAEIKVWLGYEPEPVYMGRFAVDEWERRGPVRTLRISAKAAALTTAIRAAKSRSWHDLDLGDIVDTIAGEHGLQVKMHDEMRAIHLDHIDQQSESDLGFMTRLAKRSGATFKLADGNLIFAKKAAKTLPSGQEKEKIELRPGDVSTWSATDCARGECGSVICFWMDRDAGKRTKVVVGEGDPAHQDRKLYATEAEALAAAQAQFGTLNRGQKRIEIDGPGNPAVYAEAMLSLRNFDQDVDGEYIVKGVRHSLDEGGFLTSIHVEVGGEEEGGD